MLMGGSVLLVIGQLLAFIGGIFGIVVLVYAFMDEIWKGIVGLICFIYLIYWGFAEFQHPKKNLFMGLWLGLSIIGVILLFAGGGMAAMSGAGSVNVAP